MRERIHEFEFLMSVDFKRKEIIAQILLELYTVATTTPSSLLCWAAVAKQFYTELLTSDEIPPQRSEIIIWIELAGVQSDARAANDWSRIDYCALTVLFQYAIILMKETEKKFLSQMN